MCWLDVMSMFTQLTIHVFYFNILQCMTTNIMDDGGCNSYIVFDEWKDGWMGILTIDGFKIFKNQLEQKGLNNFSFYFRVSSIECWPTFLPWCLVHMISCSCSSWHITSCESDVATYKNVTSARGESNSFLRSNWCGQPLGQHFDW